MMAMNKEIWKDIKGYEGFYQVSNLGRVRSLPRPQTKGGILKPNIRNGYEAVILCVEGNIRNISVHRLVAKAFIENPKGYKIVNHIDENKLNNNASNLEWCTQSQNIRKSSKASKNLYRFMHKPEEKPIAQYDLNGKFIRKWESATQAKREGGYDDSNIRKCCIGERNKHKGYKWKYI